MDKKIGILCAGDDELAPFLPIRTVTDTADHGAAENFERNCRRASEISARLTAALLEILRETES